MDQLQTAETEVISQRALFDYSKLDQETQVLVRLRAGEIKSAAKRIAADVVEIGGKLAEVKDRIGGNGKFNDWLSSELGWSERTAYNFIAVWQKFGAANFALENVATSALYLLAAPSTPAEAVEVARQIADSGEKVTHGVAQEIVRQAKSKRPKQKDLIEEPEGETGRQGDRETGGGVEGGADASPPITAYVGQAELEEMGRYCAAADIDQGRPVEIYHLPPYREEDSFVITDAPRGPRGVLSATGWKVKPERDAGDVRQRNHPADLVDEVPEYAESYLGVRINAGSKDRPEWWVVVGPAYEFTFDTAPEPKEAEKKQDLPLGWGFDGRAEGFCAITSERNMRTLVFATREEAIASAHEIEAAKREGLQGLTGRGLASTPTALAPAPSPAPVSAQKRPASWLNETAPKRPDAWFKERVEIVITLMPGSDDRSRKVMHTVRVGDGVGAIPFVAVTTGEDDVVNNLPYETWRLLNKAADAFAKKSAKPAAKPVSKPTTKSKPAAKSKTKSKGEKKQ